MNLLAKLKSLPRPSDFSNNTFKAHLVFIEPTHYSPEPDLGQDWLYFRVYVVTLDWNNSIEGFDLGLCETIQLLGEIFSDVKVEGLICYWNPKGLLEVSGESVIKIRTMNY